MHRPFFYCVLSISIQNNEIDKCKYVGVDNLGKHRHNMQIIFSKHLYSQDTKTMFVYAQIHSLVANKTKLSHVENSS